MEYYYLILPFSGLVISLGLGAFTIRRAPGQASNRAFFAGMLSLAAIEATDLLSLYSYISTGTPLPFLRISIAARAVMPVAWLVFSLVFARGNYGETLRRWLPAILLAGATGMFFAAFAIFTDKIIWPYSYLYPGILSLGPLGRYFSIFLIVALVVNLVHLENTFKSSDGLKRWQIKYIVFGIGAVHAFFIYLYSRSLLYSSFYMTDLLLASAVIVICSAMMAVFIVRHRLFDVNIFISRYVVYNSVTVLVVGLYLFLTGVVVYGAKYLQVPFGSFFLPLFAFVSMLGLVVLLFTATLRRKLQFFINRHFYSHKYEFRDKWMETIEKIGSKMSVEDVKNTLTEMIEETTGAEVFIWLYDEGGKRYVSARGDLPEGLMAFDAGHGFVKKICKSSGVFALDELSPDEEKEIMELKEKTRALVCARLAAGQETVGFMLLGRDSSGRPYTQDDFDLFKALVSQAGAQIKNIRLSSAIMNMRGLEVFSKTSAFVMHDLKNLTNSLSLVSQNARHNMDNVEFQQDAIRTIDMTVGRMKRLIDRLSRMPESVEITREPVSLDAILDGALKKVALAEKKDVEVIREAGDAPILNVDPEAIEMVIINLISNAYDAIDGRGEIRISTVLNASRVCLTVSDNGRGMTREFMEKGLFVPFATTKEKGLGIGLYQCKTIIEAHNGSIDVESNPDKGTAFRISLPVDVQ